MSDTVPSRPRRRWPIVVLVLLVGVGGLIGYAWWASVGKWIPGTYITSVPGVKPHVVRYNADGTIGDLPNVRWRVAGRMLILEPAATEPPGWIESLRDRFREPIVGNTVTRQRIVSADETGFVLSLGIDLSTGKEFLQRFDRQPGGP